MGDGVVCGQDVKGQPTVGASSGEGTALQVLWYNSLRRWLLRLLADRLSLVQLTPPSWTSRELPRVRRAGPARAMS